MSYSAKVIAGGKIVIPAELRRELGIRDGDTLVIDRDDAGGMVIKPHLQVVREMQAAFRAMVGEEYSVDRFLTDRKAMWGEED